MADPKKAAAMIVEKLGPPKGEPADDAEAGREAAAEEFLQAVERKDPKALVSAFQSLVELCSESEEPALEPSPSPMKE